ncbi:MAG: ABC transporter ATP-binding protein [Desulfobulbaceae bacterium]|nr:ABC transporter ATP-binding protein [Desulfobulbaceae bacterium]
MSFLKIENLTKNYTVDHTSFVGVDNISLTINKGDFLSIVGHSGSGKTTLVSLVGGILKPTSGRVLLDGTDICTLDDNKLSEYRANRIGFMFQFASLLPILTAMENVLLPRIFNPYKNVADEKAAMDLLELVGIGEKKDSYPSQLSGGQQRRVAIARALLNKPDIILADEPTGDLDEDTEAEIMNLFEEINQKQGVTIILITHNLELAGKAQKKYRMSKGQLVDI